MPNMLIIYSHRNSDHTLDILSADVQVGSSPALFPTPELEIARSLAASQARRTMEIWHVIDNGHFGIASDADVKCYGYQVLATVEPEMAFSAIELDPPGDSPLGDDEGDALPSFYACLVAECQAELDARMAVPVVDVEFAPVGWAA